VTVFVHGVVPAAFEPPALDGLGDPPARVRTIHTGDLGVLVSDLPADATPGTRADLEAHMRVLTTVVEAGATVVPMRFGMVLDEDDAVREQLLERRRDDLLGLLRDLDGRVQLTLRGVYAEDVVLREVAQADPEIPRLSAATRDLPEADAHRAKVRLGELVARGVERRREEDERAVLDRIAPHAERVIVEEPKHERMAVHVQLLVARDRREDLDAAVRQLAAEQDGRISFRYVGPLAPWSFADVRLDAEENAWA
jgi:Gas vesicle synthesis protein GvpL/GvpF